MTGMKLPFGTIFLNGFPLIVILLKIVAPSLFPMKVGIGQFLAGLMLGLDDLLESFPIAGQGLDDKQAGIAGFSARRHNEIGTKGGGRTHGQVKQVIQIDQGHDIGIQKHDTFVLRHLQQAKFVIDDLGKGLVGRFFQFVNVNLQGRQESHVFFRQGGSMGIGG